MWHFFDASILTISVQQLEAVKAAAETQKSDFSASVQERNIYQIHLAKNVEEHSLKSGLVSLSTWIVETTNKYSTISLKTCFVPPPLNLNTTQKNLLKFRHSKFTQQCQCNLNALKSHLCLTQLPFPHTNG